MRAGYIFRLLVCGIAALCCAIPPASLPVRAEDKVHSSHAAEGLKGDRLDAGVSKPTAFSHSDATAQPDGIVPSAGVDLYRRMGVLLPALPPEKPFKDKPDLAFGAYQRGLFGTALDLALTRAGEGDAAAQTLVAEMMTKGHGMRRDAKNAAFWYKKSAESGDPAGMFSYSMLLVSGKEVPRDRNLADDYMRRAADAGHAQAQFNWAQILISQNPGEKGLALAMPYYEKSAQKGVADAQYAVAQIYHGLKSLPSDKVSSARDWLKKAALSGYDTAQLDMGLWLVNGVGGIQDYEAGFKWIRIAAIRGNVVAQNKLAHLYIQALGTRPDPVEAAKWFLLSSRAGLRDAGLEDFWEGINEETQHKAAAAAQAFRQRAMKAG